MLKENIPAERRKRKLSKARRSLRPSTSSRDGSKPDRATPGSADRERCKVSTKSETRPVAKLPADTAADDDACKPQSQPLGSHARSFTFEAADLLSDEIDEQRRELRKKQQKDDANLHRLMDNLKKMDGGVWMPKMVRQLTNTGDQAIVLAQILYWFDYGTETEGAEQLPRAGKWRDDKRWFYKTHREFAEEVGMKPRQVRAALQWLKEQGFIEVEYHLAQGGRTTFIHLDFDATFAAMRKAYDARTERYWKQH